MNKYNEITTLVQEQLKKATNSSEEWMSFLTTASYTYNYAYPNQVLIWAQKPDTRGCADFAYWNDTAQRRISRGSHGIALIDTSASHGKIRYVFDVADTHGNDTKWASMPWFITENNRQTSIQALCTKNNTDNIDQLLTLWTAQLTAEYLPSGLDALEKRATGSNLEWFSKEEQSQMLDRLIRQSAEYMVAIRFGQDVSKLDTTAFDSIKNFDTVAVSLCLGNVLRQVSKPILNRIGSVVKEIDSLARQSTTEHNVTAEQENNQIEKEGLNNAVQEHERVYDSGSDYQQSTDRGDWQIRESAEGISAGERSGDIRRDDNQGNPVSAPAGSGERSEGRDRTDDEQPSEDLSGSGQKEQPLGVGTAHEQSESASRGNGNANSASAVSTETKAESNDMLSAFSLPISENYQEIEIFNVPGLFANGRIEEDLIPNGLYRYELRGSDQDSGYPIRIEKSVLVNHAGTVVTALELPVPEPGSLEIGDELSFTGNFLTIEALFERKNASNLPVLKARMLASVNTAKQHSINEPISISNDSNLSNTSDNTIKKLPHKTFLGEIEAEESVEKTDNFSFTQEIIDKILCRGSGVAEGKMRIYEQFQKSLSAKDNADFLKKEYGVGGCYPALSDTHIDETHDSKGIRLSYGFESNSPRLLLSWIKVEKRIALLIHEGKYLNEKEKGIYPQWQEEQEQRQLAQARDNPLNEYLSVTGKSAFIDHFYVVKDLQVQGPLDLSTYPTLDSAFHAYEALPKDKLKALGIHNTNPLPGSLDMVQCIDGNDKLIQDYKAVEGWENPEVIAVVDALRSHLNISVDQNNTVQKRPVQVGDVVYLEDNQAFTIEHFGMFDIMLRNEEMPLINRSISNNDFYNLLRKNHRNDHLDLPQQEPLESRSEDDLLDMAKEIISIYWKDEFLDENPVIDDLTKVPLAYTTSEDENHEIQVNANLKDYSVRYYYDGKEVNCEQYDDLSHMIDAHLSYLNFDQMVNECQDYYDKLLEKEKDNPNTIHTVAKQLSDFLTVQGYEETSEDAAKDPVAHYEERLKDPDFVDQVSDSIQTRIESGKLTNISADEAGMLYWCMRQMLEYRMNGLTEEQEKIAQAFEIAGLKYNKDSQTDEDHIVFGDFPQYPMTFTSWEEAYDWIDKAEFKDHPELREKIQAYLHPEQERQGDGDSPFVAKALQDAAALSEPYQYEPINYTAPYTPTIISTPKEKYKANIDAIRLLKTIEQRVANGGALANSDEQQTLALYSGWGGISEAFDETKLNWNSEYQELKELLSPSEYDAARSSTLTAFYTPAEVIHPIYRTLERFGVTGGNILDPSMGIGAFFAQKPSAFDLNNARLHGVELDSITGRIAKQLYQKANIQVCGYEKADLPDSYFDAAIGNVPFGDYGVSDRKYDRLNFRIHDYFLAKTIDKLRVGGIMAFITTSGTMDKQNSAVRKYLAARCTLIGAVRLPNSTFKQIAGTEVTSDILFLQKRDRLIDKEEPWNNLGTNEDGITINQYFIEHPEMICGKLQMISGPYGPVMACLPNENESLEVQLDNALNHLEASLPAPEIMQDEEKSDITAEIIPADSNVRNFSFTLKDEKIYYRENSIMREIIPNNTAAKRIKDLIALRDTVRELLQVQLNDMPDETVHDLQDTLNRQYDAYKKSYGLINSRGSSMAFSDDSSYFLLCSLELLDDDGNYIGKSDLFTKRTVRAAKPIEHADTASDALAVSIGEKARVDLAYMQQLTGKSEEKLLEELSGVVFKVPTETRFDGSPLYVTADEYLSGNVRQKLAEAQTAAKEDPSFLVNVQALELVQPKELDASEISVRIGATWIPTEIYREFMFDMADTPYYVQRMMDVYYVPITGVWNIKNKNADRGNIKVNMTYGTERANFFKLLEESLNLRAIRIFDTTRDSDGNETRVLNSAATQAAQAKQQEIEEAFKEWIFKDQTRRLQLVKLYNEKFNSLRPREFDGSHITFQGMSPEITLRPHQKNAIAHILYGGNTLLAHVVGAGKTFEMVAAAMEQKRLGLCSKTMICVPNHLTEQLASEALTLYPNAKILVATKKDFSKSNRKRFCSKIATGDYDIIVIGHSQFERIPLSTERQAQYLNDQILAIVNQTAELKASNAENFTVKQMERMKKQLEKKLEKLNNSTVRDDVVTFEELGVDNLMVDEAHNFKNLMCPTKMRNVAGISQTESQKASDLLMKCMYLDETTDGHITFATGTPISNSMTEMYTMMRYLQYHTLEQNGIVSFDSWASTFGQTVTAIELAPEGTGYRTKTRFAKFYNLPELMSLFKMSADIQTADMLNLPVPELVNGKPVDIALEPSDIQKEMVQELGERAEAVRTGSIDPSEDNMLKITNDGRKLALDQRLINPDLPDDPNSKVNACVERVFDIWQKTAEDHSTQLVFCDLSTPRAGVFNVYDDMRNKLVARGIPEEEIQFIHDANSETKKAELFGKVRSGTVRILMGSTAKMGAGTNVQRKLIALHHLDVPWRPSDIEQREGRMVRQGNENKEVQIFRYVTSGTFDAYSWQLIENKQRFISQIMTSKSPARACDDLDDAALSYAEVKALAAGNPLIKEKMDLDVQVTRLKTLKASYTSQHYRLEDALAIGFPSQVQKLKSLIANAEIDAQTLAENTVLDNEGKELFSMVLDGKLHTEKDAAGKALLGLLGAAMNTDKPVEIGEYKKFTLQISYLPLEKEFRALLVGAGTRFTPLGADAVGNITRINNLLNGIAESIPANREKLNNLNLQIENARSELAKPFQQEEELAEKSKRLAELDALLNMQDKVNIIDIDSDVGPEKSAKLVDRNR